MLTYQGETIEFSCTLIGDDGEQITDLSAYKISCMLRERDNQKIIWSTTGTASTLPIVVSNGEFSYSCGPEVTRPLSGTFILEVKFTNISTGKVVIGVAKEHITIAPSVLGQDGSL